MSHESDKAIAAGLTSSNCSTVNFLGSTFQPEGLRGSYPGFGIRSLRSRARGCPLTPVPSPPTSWGRGVTNLES